MNLPPHLNQPRPFTPRFAQDPADVSSADACNPAELRSSVLQRNLSFSTLSEDVHMRWAVNRRHPNNLSMLGFPPTAGLRRLGWRSFGILGVEAIGELAH
jgi:hypothetical protein